MGAVYFYHLTHAPLESVLPTLLEKSRAAGWRIVVRGTRAGQLEWLDQKLWSGNDDSFLPHGLAGGPHDDAQPILLTREMSNPNAPDCMLAVDGADVTPDEINALQRVSIVFDGNDPEALTKAREQWKSLTSAGCSAQYWSQENGLWEKKAEKNT